MGTRGIQAIVAASVVALWLGHADVAFGQNPAGGSTGAGLFSTHCAVCHGTSGKGDGPLASQLKTPPANLTQIAIRNKGTYPSDQVARIIDGRNPVAGHGGGDMPVWGEVFSKSIDPTPVDEKIKLLVRYIDSLQQRQ